MTSRACHFSIGVRGIDGSWPEPPRTWSHSSLREATTCPRRWMLSRATYPGLWQGWGYPPRPSLPALLGDIVHRVLEVLVATFSESGCTSLADVEAVAVLKRLGGYSALAERGIEEELAKLADNPRISNDRIAQLRTALKIKVPEIRQRVQAVMARTRFLPASFEPEAEASLSKRGPLPEGTYPEVELFSPDLRLMGRVDRLKVSEAGCEVTDYKTGAPDPHHAEQVRFYALLWRHDRDLNPQGWLMRRLVLSYPSHDVEIAPPTAQELDELAATIGAQITYAEAALRDRPPPAYPEATLCALCDVRQLCDEYWTVRPGQLPDAGSAGSDWFDFEGTVIRRNGARSWLLASTAKPDLLLRTASETVPFEAGDRLRLLGLHRETDEESPLPVGVLTQGGEIFFLGGAS